MGFSNRYIVGFAVVICLVCSLAVSALAVALKNQQEENKVFDRNKNIVLVAGLVDRGKEKEITKKLVEELFQQIEVLVIERDTGEVDPAFDPEKAKAYDMFAASKDPAQSVAVTAADAGLEQTTVEAARRAQVKRLPNKLLVYKVNKPGQESTILSIWGNGLWSTMHAFLGMKPDGVTVANLKYYLHAETPGLGGEVDNPKWIAQWPDKQVYGAEGKVRVYVGKGASQANEKHGVDALSGATITSNGVTAMLDLWLGPDGYQKFLAKQSTGE